MNINPELSSMEEKKNFTKLAEEMLVKEIEQQFPELTSNDILRILNKPIKSQGLYKALKDGKWTTNTTK